MYCTNCGSLLPENARFCPECGAMVNRPAPKAEPAAKAPATVEEPVVAEEQPVVVEEPVAVEQPAAAEAAAAEEQPVVVEEPIPAEEPVPAEEPAIAEEPAAAEEPVIAEEPVPAEEPVIAEEPAAEEPAFVCPCVKSAEPSAEVFAEPSAPVKAPAPKGLHPVATISIVLLALTASFLLFALMGLYLQLNAALPVVLAVLAIVSTVLTFGLGIAAFIVGLVRKRPATWIVGLAAALLGVANLVLAVVYLIGSVIAAIL